MDLRTQLESALGNSHRIIRELGGGGMSRVFLAEDTEHDRQIVVKVIPEELAGQVSIERFRREIKVAARLQHPCIVPVLGSGSADGLPYYTMPFVEGESLRSRLSREKGLAVPQALRILRDVAGALAYAHEHGVMHRDIKPDNILVTRHHAVLVDFGVAKALTDSTQAGQALTSVGVAIGTPAYMAPEQAAADSSLDHRADIYSLGVVAYEMLAGRHPFEGRAPQSMLAAHAIEMPTGIIAHRSQLSASIASLVMRMLEKHPGDRPQTAEEVLTALDQIATPEAPTAASPTRNFTDSSARKRKKLIVAIGTAGAGLALIALSLLPFRHNARTSASLSPSNVLVLAPSVPTDGNPTMSRGADRIRDALMQGLSRVNTARLVNRPEENVQATLSPGEAGRRESAGTVVTGTLYPVGSGVEVQFKLVDATTDRVIRTFEPRTLPHEPSDSDLRSAIDPVLTGIGFITEPSLGAVTIPTVIPAYAAFEDFRAGFQLARETDFASFQQAFPLFRKAFERDTSFIQSQLCLAWLLRTTGRTRSSTQSAEEFDSIRVYVAQRRSRLSPYEQVIADVIAERMSTDRGVAALRKLIVMVPKAPFRQALSHMLLDMNRPYGADSAFTDVLKSDSSLTLVPAFWLARAGVYHYIGDYQNALDAANHARKLAPSDIRAFRPALNALAAMGDTAAFQKILEQAAAASSPFYGIGDLYLEAGQELIAHGHPALGAKTLKLAADWFDARTPQQLATATVGPRAALAYVDENRLDDAERLLKPHVSLIDPDVRFLGLLGRIAAIRGDTILAMRYSQQLAALPAEKLSGVPTFERAQIAAELNQRAEAVSFLRDAFSQGVVFNYRARMHVLRHFMRMKDYPPFKALITPQG